MKLRRLSSDHDLYINYSFVAEQNNLIESETSISTLSALRHRLTSRYTAF